MYFDTFFEPTLSQHSRSAKNHNNDVSFDPHVHLGGAGPLCSCWTLKRSSYSSILIVMPTEGKGWVPACAHAKERKVMPLSCLSLEYMYSCPMQHCVGWALFIIFSLCTVSTPCFWPELILGYSCSVGGITWKWSGVKTLFLQPRFLGLIQLKP